MALSTTFTPQITARLRLAGAGESNGRVGAGVAALLVWVRAELRLTEGSVLLAMGEPKDRQRDVG